MPETKCYRECVRCVMDTSDPDISFDSTGQCSYCSNFDGRVRGIWLPNDDGWKTLRSTVDRIKDDNRNRDYDCIIGLSGGIDSSYAAYLARKKLDLRLLAVHVDAGWNSELAVGNIENVVKHLGIDLYTHVVDWEEMKDLQVAFLKSGLANQDVPQDHAFFSALYEFAVQNNIQWVLSGGNIATESVLPSAWGYNAMDLKHLFAIHRRYGRRRLRTFPTCNFIQYYIYYPYIRGMRVLRPLNFVPYVKADALALLEAELDYRYYGTKHGESRFTKFFQGYWLPTRFGFDKRRAHLSSMILSGQTTREQAKKELSQPAYTDPTELAEDRAFVIKKLGLKEEEFNDLLQAPIRNYQDYPSNAWLFELKDRLKPFLLRLRLGGAQK